MNNKIDNSKIKKTEKEIRIEKQKFDIKKTKKDFDAIENYIKDGVEAVQKVRDFYDENKNKEEFFYYPDWEKISGQLAAASSELILAGLLMESHVGRVNEIFDSDVVEIYRGFRTKTYTKVDLKDLEFDFEKIGNVIHITSNFRCPNVRSSAYDYGRMSTFIQQTFNNEATKKFGATEIKHKEGYAYLEPERPFNKQIGKCYMVFVHHYIDIPKYQRDVDNYLEKPLSDAIAYFFILGGDAPDVVRRMSLAVPDKKNFTEVYLVPQEEFPTWNTTFQHDVDEKIRRDKMTELERASEDLFADWL